MEIILWTWASQKNTHELETKYSTVCDSEKKQRLATCLPFCQSLLCK